MKKILFVSLAFAGWFGLPRAGAISLDDIQLWIGSGTNRAALVIEWSSAESLTNSSVPVPVADKTLVWGYRFNGTATGTQMFDAILAADPKLYAVADETYGTYIEAIGYNLNSNGVTGITDGVSTNFITNGILTDATVDVDAAQAINGGDLYWGGYFGPNWEVWNESGDAGGFSASPNRGTNEYWTANDPANPYSGSHGQWELAEDGLDLLPLTNGSWIGFSVAAGEYETNPIAAYNLHKHAPPSPDGTYTAYVCNTNDFAIQVVSANNVSTASPYNDPTAILNRPALKFVDSLGSGSTNRTKIIEPPYNVAPGGGKVIAKILAGGQITVKLGRKIYNDPNNPYGIDLIVYGNSFFSASGAGAIGDGTDLDIATLSGSPGGHPTTVSVSQDGTNWFTFSNTPVLFPDNAYRWDETNHSWTDEQMNPTKPLNPSVPAMNFGGQPAAAGLDQFIGAAGGTGYDLKASGLPWIQYVRVQPGAGTYTVIDAIAAVDPVMVGDALSITPDNLASGITNLVFQNPDDSSQSLVSINFNSVSAGAKVSTTGLSEFSSFAPVPGNVSWACQITLKPVTGNSPVSFLASVGLRAGENYNGNGSDLRVFQWSGAYWNSQAFTFNATNHEAVVAGVTNSSAFAIAQIVAPQLGIQTGTNGPAFRFTPVPNCPHVLERSTNLVTWVPIATNTPADAQPVTWQDNAAPPGMACYRLWVNLP